MSKNSIYTVGGTVQAGSGFYIPRRADDQLLSLCLAYRFAYILSPRQMGKSSLMVRTAETLAKQGIQSIIIDLTQLGVQVTAEEWYLGLLTTIEDQLMLNTNVVEWWQARAHLGISQRLALFFKEVLLTEIKMPVVVFVDEIDTTLSLSFTDDFFATIRYLYNARAHEPEFRRLSFVLIGVATPSDLIRDPQRTPFNIGQRVELTDWSFDEASPLAQGLGLPSGEAGKVLGWVLKWTGGHPYLTQHLCNIITNRKRNNWEENDVDQLVYATFLGGNSEDHNLQFVRDMLTKRAPDPAGTLAVYQEIRFGRRPVYDEEQSLIKSHLKLSGVVHRENGLLYLRNPIYREVFDKKWVKDHLPVNWAKRLQRAAVALIITLLLLSFPLALYAWNRAVVAERRGEEAIQQRQEALQQRQEAIRQSQIAEQQRQEADRLRLEAEERRQEAEKSKLVAEQQRQLAEARRQEADHQRQLAELQRREADRLRQEAEQQRLIALEQSHEANRLRQEAEQQSMANKADFYRARGDYAEAEPLYLKNLEYLQNTPGNDVARVATALNNLAIFYKEQNNYVKAEPLYQQALEILIKIFGPEDEKVALGLSNLADLYRVKGDYAQAEPLYKRSLDILQKLFGRAHPSFATVSENYGILLRQVKRDDEAAKLESATRSSRDLYAVTGSFEGRVVAQPSSPVAGAVVQFINQASGVVTATGTDSDGRFFQSLLLPGIYTIRISARGFKTWEGERRLLNSQNNRLIPVPVILDSEDAPAKPSPTPSNQPSSSQPTKKGAHAGEIINQVTTQAGGGGLGT